MLSNLVDEAFRLLRRFVEPRLDLPLALFRCALGLVMLASYVQLLLDYDTYFSHFGMCPRTEWHNIIPERSVSYFLYVKSDAIAKGVAIAGVVPMLLFTAGIFPRAAALASFYALISIHDRCPLLLDGADIVIRLMLFFFIFARSDRRLSPIAPVVRASPSDSFPVRLMQIQLCLIYFTTGLQKLYGVRWQNGTALAYTLQLDSFSRGNWTRIAENPWAVNTGTYITLAFELSFIFLVWARSTRPWILAMGVGMHAGIEILMYIPIFSWVMIASYIVFVEPAWAERAVSAATLPLARWARNSQLRATVQGAGSDGIAQTLRRLDVFEAVAWSGDGGGGTPRLRLEDAEGHSVEGFRAVSRLALRVPAMICWLPVLAIPGGLTWMDRSLASASR